MLKHSFIIIDPKVNDTIKAVSDYYDIHIYKSFVDFKNLVEYEPTIVEVILVTENALVATSSAVESLIDLYNQPFLEVTNKIVYLLGPDKDPTKYTSTVNGLPIEFRSTELTQANISKYIMTDASDFQDSSSSVSVYRVRRDEYRKRKLLQESNADEEDDSYINLDEELSKVKPIDIPEQAFYDAVEHSKVYYVAGKLDRTQHMMSLVFAQYLAHEDKVLLLEPDTEYHSLSDICVKEGIDAEIFMAEDIIKDGEAFFHRIINSKSKIVLVTSKEINLYSYEFMFSILHARLQNHIKFFIKETPIERVPYAEPFIIVAGDTIADLLYSIRKIKSRDETEVKLLLVQDAPLKGAYISIEEAKYIISRVMHNTSNIKPSILRLKGVSLGKEDLYDLCSILEEGSK